jgi:putative molybdenum carrier protein
MSLRVDDDNNMIERILSGGQTGADQAGWRAARSAGIPTGGWMPSGFLTEDGPRPEFAELYGAVETVSGGYRRRTEANVCDRDATVILRTLEKSHLCDRGTIARGDVARSKNRGRAMVSECRNRAAEPSWTIQSLIRIDVLLPLEPVNRFAVPLIARQSGRLAI